MEKQGKLSAFLNSEKSIWLLLLLAFAARMAMFFYMGSGRLSHSDDVAYLQSGIVFAQTGVISVWSSYPTASVMPGMAVVTGIMSKLFGEGTAYLDSVRLLWIVLGSFTTYFFYKACRFHVPAPYALFAAAAFLLPNWLWSDNAALTEAPYLFFWMICLYFVFKAGESEKVGATCVAGMTLSFMAAFMFRANALIFLPFAAAYLIMKKKKARELLACALSIAAALALFIVPWSIRNYRLFDEFIPVTAGTANPGLKGTYQGENAIPDEILDYETNVYKPVREKFPDYFNADGSLKDQADAEQVSNEMDKLKRDYRLREWFKRDPMGLLWTYFVSKPACMINWVWFWLPMPEMYYTLRFFSQVNMVMCIAAVILSLAIRKKRQIMLYLSFTYAINMYIVAMSFASERYAAMFMPYRYLIAAIGLYLAVELIKDIKRKRSLSQ